MSADSPSRSKSKARTSPSSLAVLPQQVTDPTILDSVAGFINEVVPTSYNVPCDSKDQIQWAHFEQLESDESTFTASYDCEKIIHPPLILVLGYTTGIQVWAVPENGEAIEILSWHHGSVQVLRFLPTPYIAGKPPQDLFESKRPLIAVCDTANPVPAFCSLSFLSLKTGEQVKQIKFKNPVLDVLANRRSVAVTFSEKIAIFDAFTLEDRLTVTTCYISPGIYPNPVALGTRWMAYAEKKLVPVRRSSGGIEGDGVQSYTATVLHAAKSLGRGLRELGETVASSLTGNSPYKPGGGGSPQAGGQADVPQKGVITVLDIESRSINASDKSLHQEAVVAHFAAHTEAVVCLRFDPSGMLLLTADKRGHDFHLFRIQPHPGGPALAAVHHLYILHRGDTTAKVQDMCFSPDSRWVTVSTLRGTTHVFPVTPYGGSVGVRTHATPHVVNRMSRFQRSAGLTAEGRSNSPVSVFEAPVNSIFPYHNPRLPPFPHPTVVHPLAQIRQPVFMQNIGNAPPRPHGGRQRLSSGSEDGVQVALRVSCCFAPPRAWLSPVSQSREPITNKPQVKPVESVFIVNCHGTLVQYDLEPRHASSVPKERVCEDTPIELTVCAKAQWVLQRQANAADVQLPMSNEHLGLVAWEQPTGRRSKPDHKDDRWLSQVEIVTHAGPHRRLWMGPQFTFKTYTANGGSPLSVHETKTVDVGRSKPVNMPTTTAYPILIESGSVSSCDQSPKLRDTYQRTLEETGGAGEVQLKEDLADAMLESPGVREAGGHCVIVSVKQPHVGVAKVVNPLGTVVTVQSDDEIPITDIATEDVIHENRDEALFRPVVAPKAVVFAETKRKQGQRNAQAPKVAQVPKIAQPPNIAQEPKFVQAPKIAQVPKIAQPPKIAQMPKITQAELQIGANHINSVVDSAKEEQTWRNKPAEVKHTRKSKPIVSDVDNLKKSKVTIDLVVSKPAEEIPVGDISFISDFSDNFVDATDKFQPLLSKLSDCKMNVTPSKSGSSSEEEHVFHLDVLDFPQPEPESDEIDFTEAPPFSESPSRIEDFEDANAELQKQQVETFSSSEEEKPITKKPRKPKPKLGVRIPNIGKENGETVTVTPPTKKTWSSIAATKPKEDDIDNFEEAHFTIEFPKKSSHLIEINDDCTTDILQPEKLYSSELKTLTDDLNVLKVDNKSSDDEKISSSQTETTESDDSSKIPEVTTVENEDDVWQAMTNNSNGSNNQSSRSARRKSKKKKK